MSLFQRVPDFACQSRSYAPLFKYIDDHSHNVTPQFKPDESTLSMKRSSDFYPSFDVRETSDSYELHGELPGVDKTDLRVEVSGEDTLTITGNKERSYITTINEEDEIVVETPPSEDDSDWQQVKTIIENIDAATIGPIKGRRTSLVDLRQWQPPTQNIDSWSHVHTEQNAQRRPSITNARIRQAPREDIDSWSRVHTTEKSQRRQSVTNASEWEQPVENIDASTAVHSQERARRRPSIVDARTYEQPKENIDAATSGPTRRIATESTNNTNANTTSAPRRRIDSGISFSQPRSSLTKPTPKHQPWLLSERPFGTFWREFKFPTAVDRDGVKASLKEGVLTVVVPKRITVLRNKKVIAVE